VFGTLLFHEAEIYRAEGGKLVAEFICHQPNKYWEGTWGLSTFLGAIRNQLQFHLEVTLGEIELEDDWKRLTLLVPLSEGPAAESLHCAVQPLKNMMHDAEIALGGIFWKPEYAKDERIFVTRCLRLC
jgi:hypothetical protein